jgi:hypothetical protein
VVISGFDWDNDNLLHIERHQFTPEEVKEVLPAIIKFGELVRSFILPWAKLSTGDWRLWSFAGCPEV